MNPTISVLMPVYNAERYVAQAVQSILDQTYRDFEFLIVDDGSTDRSLEILKRFAAQDDRIRLISRPNTGLVVALNEMLDLARGEFIARMDADDVSQPLRFFAQHDRLTSDPELVALGTAITLIDPTGRKIRDIIIPKTHEAIDAQNLRGFGLAICHPSLMARTITMRTINGYDSQFWPAEDVDCFLKLAEIGKLSNLDLIGIHYRLHLSSVGHTNRESQRQAAWRAGSAARARRGLLPLDPICEDIISKEDDFRIRWAWWALKGRNISTARGYALQAFFRKPWSFSRIRLLYCAVRGY